MKLMTKVKLTGVGLVGAGLAASFIADDLGYGLKPSTQENYSKALQEEVGRSITEQTAFNMGRFVMDEVTSSRPDRTDIIGAQTEMVRRTGHHLNENPQLDAIAACAITLVSVPETEVSPTSLPPMVSDYYKPGQDQNYPAAEQLCLDATAAAITDGRINRIYFPETVA